MKFRFCGDSDCPDWILSEINILSRLSSIKLKLLAQIVVQGLLNPPVDIVRAEKIFMDSKLDSHMSIKGCMACLLYVLTSTVRYNCDYNALHSELQQLGLPREHSSSIKKVIEEYGVDIGLKLKSSSLKCNNLDQASAKVDQINKYVTLDMLIDKQQTNVVLTPFALDALLENLKSVRSKMLDLQGSPFVL